MQESAATAIVPSVAYRLRVVASYDSWRAGQEFIVEGALTIGRDSRCDIVLADTAVSRQHAWVTVAPAGLEVRDLDSGNGIWVGAARVTQLVLRHGQRFQVGSTHFECVEVPRVEPATQPFGTSTDALVEGFVVQCLSTGEFEEESRSFLIEGGSATIGRTPDCEIQLHQRDVSRRHARIERLASGFLITDLGSACGTWVGPQSISDVVLAAGESFRVGAHVELKCVLKSDAAEEAPTDRGDMTSVMPPERIQAAQAVEAVVTETSPMATAMPQAVVDAPIESSHIVPGAVASPGLRPEPPVVETPSEEPAATETEEPDLDFSATIVIPLSVALAAQAYRLEELGEAVALRAQEPFLLDDPLYAWYVVSGGILLFGVAVEDKRPVGPRTHLLGIQPGQCCFGIDTRRYGLGSGILAVAKPGTTARKIPVAELRALAGRPDQREVVAGLIDAWVGGLAKALTRDISGRRAPEVYLKAGEGVKIPSKAKASTGEAVVWIDISNGSILVDDLATAQFARRRILFPVTPDLWFRPIGEEFGELTVTPVTTLEGLTQPDLWSGLDVLCRIFCECEFINKKLAAADEFVRLEQKARYSEAAEAAGYDAIGSVLTESERPFEFDRTTREPVLQACKVVGRALGIEIVSTTSASEEMAYEDHVNAIANASGFRVRLVALRDDWWRRDQGPLLGQLADSKTPVALLPKGPVGYELVDARSGERRPITETVAGTLSGFAYFFYRPLPGGALRPIDLIRFGAVGCRRDYRSVALMAVFLGALGTVTPYFMGQLFDTALPQADKSLLYSFTVALFVSAVASSLFKLTQGIATVRLQTRMEASIQAAVWDRLLDLPVTFFRRYAAGDLADRANGVDQIQELVAGAGVAAILGSISGLFFVVQMFAYDLYLALTAMLLTAIFVAVTTVANLAQLRYQRSEVAVRGRIAGLVLNLIGGVSKLRVCGAEPHAFRVWAVQFAEQKRIAFSVGNIQNVSSTFSAIFPTLSSIAIFVVMLYEQDRAVQAREAALTVGQFIAFNSAYGMFLAAMQALADASLSLLRIVPIYERLSPILTTPAEIDRSKVSAGKLRGGISISRLHFRYQADGPFVVKDLTLEIKPGEFVAFVGSSGCGKSTLMRLMLGFEQASSGSIAYDGQDISSLAVRTLRQQIGVVLQISRVMPTELYRNITGTSARTIEDAWDAAEKAGLAEDIKQMPMGMHTYVSEGGGTLSGGQRQRLMIARAIVNKPNVLFLDEATSALDNRTQSIVTESLSRMKATRVVIAHRLSTIMHADKICYMDGGAIVEMGTYDELMALNGRFAELARRQVA